VTTVTVSGPTTTVNASQDLFYRCKFSELLEVLEREQAEGETLDPDKLLVKANALFELHRVQEARDTLRSVSRTRDGFDESYLYALARVTYLDGRFDEARRIFAEVARETKDERHRFKGLLGVANSFFSTSRFDDMWSVIKELSSFEPLERDDDRISLTILLGNYWLASGRDNHLAKNYFKKALGAAAANTWTYFITRSLFGMATVCEREGQTSELAWTLEILTSFVDESEQLFFAHIVNEHFKSHFSINVPMEFDTANRRIMIKSRWVPFHDKPLLFQFLLLLHTKGAFVGKEDIAVHLWPHEEYKPRLHDPRIFDIARRARQLIETYESQPVVLLSGRMGYKLAST
jgi:hypothetical protein